LQLRLEQHVAQFYYVQKSIEMEKEIQIFNSPQFGEVRTTQGASGEPLFCLADVCEALQLNPSKVSHLININYIMR